MNLPKIILGLVFFMLLMLGTRAQENLVPNPSFEDTLGCPVGYPDLDTKCKFWKSFKGSPDYMNDCSACCGSNNQFGYQEPHSGEAYSGIGTYQTSVPNLREHIAVELITPLVIGTQYFISFYVSTAWTGGLTTIATNKIGALLTTYSYSDPDLLLPLPNACTFYSNLIISDTVLWTKVTGSFIADSAYQFLVIGNFFSDDLVDTINLPYQFFPVGAYYFLDDVCLSTDSIYAETWTGISENVVEKVDLEVFPNPADKYCTLKSNELIQLVTIKNALGEIVYIKDYINKDKIELSTENLASGFYFIEIKTKKGIKKSKLIIN
jgi:OmpA-OmpF porin, OOP family